jgi:cytochrome c-type biogenesis protein CcmH
VRRTLSYLAMALVAAVALAVGVVDQRDERTTEERMQDVAATIRCPACGGQSAAGSDTAAAQAVRREITERIEAGESDDEIRDYFASTFGEELLLTPPRSGVGSLVWIIPVVVLVVGGAGLAVAFRRWRAW